MKKKRLNNSLKITFIKIINIFFRYKTIVYSFNLNKKKTKIKRNEYNYC